MSELMLVPKSRSFSDGTDYVILDLEHKKAWLVFKSGMTCYKYDYNMAKLMYTLGYWVKLKPEQTPKGNKIIK